MRMPGVSSERATQYRDQAEHFQLLATVEMQPRARAQLLEIADQYRQLADTEPRKPSAGSPAARARNE
jgi:hypothetical protein